MLEFSIKLPKVAVDVNFFQSFFDSLAVAKAPVEEEIKDLLRTTAKTEHRYNNQTYRLNQSTLAEGSFGADLKEEIKLYVDVSSAEYAKYIILGTSKWSPDPFIENSAKKNMPAIQQKIVTLYNEEIQKFNSRV